jgi:hypothetical protein
MKGIVTNVNTLKSVDIDLDRLIEEKVLVQATNGGGKSYFVRKLCESATKKHIPQTIIQKDPEFNSLRDKFDYVIIGDKNEGEADIQMSLKIPELLAKKMLKLPTISFILDLSVLIVSERKQFLRRFLDVINSANKKFWHDRFFVLDEAHIFAPEKGKGTSEALRSVEELASQGRKKGFSLICCTQRPSKLSKDVTGELSCKFIGKAIDGEDRKRNAEELGMSTKPTDTLHFKKMGRPNFHFYAVGSGISDEPILVRTNKCETEHEIRRGISKKSMYTSVLLEDTIEKLGSLPEEVEDEIITIESLKNELEEKDIRIQGLLSQLEQQDTDVKSHRIVANRVEIDQDEYMDYMKIRADFIKLAVDLYKVHKDQSLKSKVKPKKKPTITHWHARGSAKVAEWILNKYPILKKIGVNPELYKDMNSKMFKE